MSEGGQCGDIDTCHQTVSACDQFGQLDVFINIERRQHAAAGEVQCRELRAGKRQFESFSLVVTGDCNNITIQCIGIHILQVKVLQSNVVVHIELRNRVTVSHDGLELLEVRQVNYRNIVTVEIQIFDVRTILETYDTGNTSARAVYILDILCLGDTDFAILIIIEKRQQISFQIRIRDMDASIIVRNGREFLLFIVSEVS